MITKNLLTQFLQEELGYNDNIFCFSFIVFNQMIDE